MVKLLAILLLFTPFALAQSSPNHRVPEEKAENASLCAVAAYPGDANHRLFRLTAFVSHGFEDFSLWYPGCTDEPRTTIWVAYGGTKDSNTVYCCPGEPGDESRSKILRIDGIENPLIDNKVFEGFTELIDTERDTTVKATFVGRFFSGKKQTVNGTTSWGGFGHFGCCSLFVIEQVESFEPHIRKDIDYSASGQPYENLGCEVDSYEDLPLGLTAAARPNQLISQQRAADLGSRAWAFDDPKQVAIEALLPFTDKRVPNQTLVKQTNGREIFRWRHDKTAITVIVAKPYWLSFYAKGTSVAWVATSIVRAHCRS
jgi:hypothetical protein